GSSHGLESLYALLDGRMCVEEVVKERRGVFQWIGDIKGSGGFVGHLKRLLVCCDLAKGGGEARWVASQKRARCVGEVLALPGHRDRRVLWIVSGREGVRC